MVSTSQRSIGEVAQETGLSVHALRFFEREELFPRSIPRTSGGKREYEQADIDWVLLCNRFRASGMALATIRRFAALVRAGPGNERERLTLLQAHQVDVENRMEKLAADLKVIQTKVAVYEQHVRDGTAAGVWSPPLPE